MTTDEGIATLMIFTRQDTIYEHSQSTKPGLGDGRMKRRACASRYWS
jgi:hypothetical protein